MNIKIIVLILGLCFFQSICSAEIKRIFFLPNGKISETAFNWKYKNADESDKDFMDRITNVHLVNLKNYPYKDTTKDNLPDKTKRDKWRWNKKDKVIYVDDTIILKSERIEKKERLLDTELAKETPDPVKVIKLYREVEKLK